MAVVMVPTGWHSGSKWDWEATVGTPVDFSTYRELTPDQLRWLTYAFPPGRACIWATSKHSDWPQPGDSVWFHHDNNVIAIAEVHAAFDAMKGRSLPLPGGCWKVQCIRLHQV